MENKQWWKSLTLALLCLWLPYYMGAWDKDKPASSTSLRASNPEILANWSAIETSFGAHHEFSTGGSNTGDNLRIKFNAPISTPTNATNKLFIYSKDVGSVVEAHILDESGNELQITSGGDLYSSTNLAVAGTVTVTGQSTFNNHINLGAGDDLLLSTTSDITISGNTFTVAGATGNTVIAGTCDITGATEVTGVATLGDGSLLKTSAAPSTDAMIANKKYVDDNTTMVPAISGAGTGYAGEESVTFPNGLIMKTGTATGLTHNSNNVITFGTAFPTACKTAVASPNRSGAVTAAGVTSKLTTSFTVYCGNTVTGAEWIAIGY